jgi:hypothetical protein
MDSNINGSKRNKSILSIEKRLTWLSENDPRNEEMYHLLKSIAGIYINQNKFVYGYNGVDDVCHDVASDVWMAVLNGKKINAWIYYIGKMIKLTYVTKQKKLEHEIINVEEDPSLKENVKRMCAASAMSCVKDFDDMQRRLMLENVPDMIRYTMNHSKFVKGTSEWLSVYTNVCINLLNDLNGHERTYFRIKEDLVPYVGIIIEQFKKDFRNSGFNDSIMDNVETDLEMSIVADETFRRENGKDIKDG